MLDDFDDVRLRDLVFFDRLVDLGTITAAARELGVPKPTAGRWLAALEDKLGGRLVVRGARAVQLTERGRILHEQLGPVLTAVRAMRARVRQGEPGGVLRVSVPVPFGRLVGGGVIAAFRRSMPGVRLEIRLQNERVDLARDRVDVAIRGGPIHDEGLVARRLAEVPMWVYRSGAGGLIAAPGDERLLPPELLPAVVVVDDRTAVCEALLAGPGVGVLPAFLGELPRARGDLVRDRGEPVSRVRVHAVFRPEQRQDARVRALIEAIADELDVLLGSSN